MPHKKGHKKISQKQSVKQTVIVKIGEVKRKRSKRSKRRPREGGEGGQSFAPIPMPVVAYSTGYGSFPLIQGAPVKEPFTYKPTADITRPVMEDVGVGTEGFVTILDKPTKKETLAELIEPAKIQPEPFRISAPSDPVKGINLRRPIESIDDPPVSVPSKPSSFPEPDEPPIKLESSSSMKPSAPEMYDVSRPQIRYGTKQFYIDRIYEMTGKMLGSSNLNLKELKYMYSVIKKNKQK